MSQKIYTLDNHRKLGDDEIIRKGDLYRDKETKEINLVKHSIGRTPGYNSNYKLYYDFYRRKHTKKPAAPVVVVPKPVVKNTPKFPEVKFLYPSSKKWGAPAERHVKVITMDDKYITGLEVGEGNSHQFKRFLVERVIDEIKLVRF